MKLNFSLSHFLIVSLSHFLTFLLSLCPFVPLSLCPLLTLSQPSEGGIPPGIAMNLRIEEIPEVLLPKINVEVLLLEDSIVAATEIKPFRFGYDFNVELNPSNSGQWIDLGGKERLWQLKIVSRGALSLNILFHEYSVPAGCKIFVYSTDKKQMLGAFTDENNYDHKHLATGLIKGDGLIIEYLVPANLPDIGKLNIEKVTHGYKTIPIVSQEKDFGTSGACNNNINCPVGNDWQDEKKAVAVIIDGGRICTGALVNNTANDGTPYFLSANHCYSNPAAWSFMFGYESPNCTNIDGPTNLIVSGATLKAKNANSDFLLLQLSSAPPPSFNVYYLGWDNSGAQPDSQVCIHHPDGDIKKISFDNDPATATIWTSTQVWEIGAWEDGTTEPGSSGAPLFDQNHRVIGQLYGGTASCSNLTDDNFGRFDASWDFGSNPSTRLKEWLDPLNTGDSALAGFDPNFPTDSLDGGFSSVLSPSGVYCSQDSVPVIVTIRNYGIDTLQSLTISYSVDSLFFQTIVWNGNLPSMTSETITLDTLFFLAGVHTVSFQTSFPNGGIDQDSSNNQNSAIFNNIYGDSVDITIKTDQWGNETTWVLKDSSGNIIYSGGPYTDFSSQAYYYNHCLAQGCYTFIIYDSYGDGMCCSAGNGFYLVKGSDGDTLASGGQFTSSESTGFCLIPPAPVAGFYSNDTQICENSSIQFFDISQNYPTAWNWTFTGGSPSTSTLKSPLVFYDSTGVFDVVLTVTNMTGSDAIIQTGFVIVDICQGSIELNTDKVSISLRPNPTIAALGIWFQHKNEYAFILSDLMGRDVLKKVFSQNNRTGNEEIKIDLENVMPGFYFYRMEYESGETIFGKLLVQ